LYQIYHDTSIEALSSPVSRAATLSPGLLDRPRLGQGGGTPASPGWRSGPGPSAAATEAPRDSADEPRSPARAAGKKKKKERQAAEEAEKGGGTAADKGKEDKGAKKGRVKGDKDDIFGDGGLKTFGRTEEGFLIYKEDDLKINMPGSGNTADCPFDCDCCY